MIAPQPFFVERGTPIAVRAAAGVLGAAGHQVDLLVLHGGQDVALPGVNVVRAPRPPWVRAVGVGLSTAKLLCDAGLTWCAARLIRENEYDVVHAVEEAVFIALAARALRPFKLVWDMDSLLIDQMVEGGGAIARIAGALRPVERWAARRSDLLLPVCDAIAQAALVMAPAKALGLSIHVLPDIAMPAPTDPPPVDALTLAECAPPGAILALYVGNLEGYQGVDDAIDAMARLEPGSRLHLLVVGGSPMAVEAVRARARKAGVVNRVSLLGPAPLAHLPHLLAQADLLLSPRRTGVNTPMKVYTYMSSGRPIVATAILSHTQVLDDSTARLVPPGPAGLASAMAALEADPGAGKALAAAARARAAEHYGPDVFRRRLLTAYDILQ